MKKSIRLIGVSLLLIAIVLNTASCGLIERIFVGSKEERFYNLVCETQELLDKVADDMYDNWYDCIYNDKFNNDINEAVEEAYDDNDEEIEIIFENTEKINELYKDIKNGKLEDEAKEVMRAYNDYYSLVLEDSGSFNNYSTAKEPARRALSTALKNYYLELD